MAQTRQSLQSISDLLQEVIELAAAGNNADEEIYRVVENVTEICMNEGSSENIGKWINQSERTQFKILR